MLKAHITNGVPCCDFISHNVVLWSLGNIGFERYSGDDIGNKPLNFYTEFKYADKAPLAVEFWYEGKLLDRKVIADNDPDKWHRVAFSVVPNSVAA